MNKILKTGLTLTAIVASSFSCTKDKPKNNIEVSANEDRAYREFARDTFKTMTYDYFLVGRYQDALTQVNLFIKFGIDKNDSLWGYYNRAQILFKLNLIEEGNEDLKRAYEVSPELFIEKYGQLNYTKE